MKLLRLACIIAVFSLLIPGAVIAQNTVSGSVSDSSSESQQARIENARSTYPQQLSDDQKAILSTRCTTAQERLRVIAGRLDEREAAIEDVYRLIDRQLAAIQKRLDVHEMDTSIIDLLLISYRRETNSLEEHLNDYKVALGDTISINCSSDPAAFKSLLESTRVSRKNFTDAISAISDTLHTEMKSSFDAIEERLAEDQE